MDAYVVAFRIPNLFRRLFGEGAMTASFVPVLAEDLHRDRRSAWKLVTAAAVTLAAILSAITLLAELICGLLWLAWGDEPGMRLVLGLTAAMLPYTVLICLAALATATLQTLGEFRLPAAIPSVLNICWLIGAWFIAPRVTASAEGQAFIMSGCVLVGGLLQFVVQLPRLRQLGFRFEFDFVASRTALVRIVKTMTPTTLGLAITQINTLADSLIARVRGHARRAHDDRLARRRAISLEARGGRRRLVWRTHLSVSAWTVGHRSGDRDFSAARPACRGGRARSAG